MPITMLLMLSYSYTLLFLQGMDVGQFVAIRGELDGETLMGYFSPITRPSDEGVIGILARSDERGGPIAKLLEMSRPGKIQYLYYIRLALIRLSYHFTRELQEVHFTCVQWEGLD